MKRHAGHIATSLALAGALGLCACSSEGKRPDASSSDTRPAATATDAELEMGDTVIIDDGKDVYKLAVISMEPAPDSLYGEADFARAKGIVYFLKYRVTAVTVKSSFFGTIMVNPHYLTPYASSARTVREVFAYGAAPECPKNFTRLTAGQSGEGCRLYQVSGEKVTKATYNDGLTYRVVWE